MKTKTRAILNRIQACKSCGLCANQPPLLDNNKSKADVMWVGLSAVKVNCTVTDTPLSESTNTGKLIADIEKNVNSINFYKTNLVKCLPVDNERIRYPKQHEMKSCYGNLESEINEFKPKIVFLLGKQVSDFVTDEKNSFSDDFSYKPIIKGGVTYVGIHHPSYILVYKRKKMKNYAKSIASLINQYTLS